MLVRCIKCSHFLLLFMTHKSDFVCISNSQSLALYRYLSGKRETHDQSQHNHLSDQITFFSVLFPFFFVYVFPMLPFSSNNKTVLLAEPVNLNYVTSGIVYHELRHDVTGSKSSGENQNNEKF